MSPGLSTPSDEEGSESSTEIERVSDRTEKTEEKKQEEETKNDASQSGLPPRENDFDQSGFFRGIINRITNRARKCLREAVGASGRKIGRAGKSAAAAAHGDWDAGREGSVVADAQGRRESLWGRVRRGLGWKRRPVGLKGAGGLEGGGGEDGVG